MKRTKISKIKSKSKKKSSVARQMAARSAQKVVLSKPAHLEAVVRLRRVRGHLDKVIQMVEAGQPCTDILQQLSAVLSALGGCRTLLFSGHLKTCLRPALKSGNEMLIDEIEKLASRVMKVN